MLSSEENNLAVDFDGVIHDKAHPIPGRRMGGPVPGAQEALINLQRKGYRIIVFSIWAHGNGIETIAEWMRYWKIPFDDITNLKPNAQAFIDDRGIRFHSWAELESLWK